MIVTQFDATSPGGIPLSPGKFDVHTHAVAAYDDANFEPDWIGCVHKYPELAKVERVVSIASRIQSIGRILDHEKGNPNTIAQIPGWVRAMIGHRVYRPGPYSDRSDMPAVEQAMKNSGLARHEYSLWLAAPGISEAEALQLLKIYDAVQVEFAQQFDRSLCNPDFYPPLPVPHPKASASGTTQFAGEINHTTGKWFVKTTKKGTPGATPEKWSAEIQVGNESLDSRILHLPFNAPPLGGPK